MISLLLAVLAAGAANVALVAFVADRLGPKAGTISAGELTAVSDNTPTARPNAVKVGNENALTTGALRAA